MRGFMRITYLVLQFARLTEWSLAGVLSARGPALCAGMFRGPSAVLVRLFRLTLSSPHTNIISPTIQLRITVIERNMACAQGATCLLIAIACI